MDASFSASCPRGKKSWVFRSPREETNHERNDIHFTFTIIVHVQWRIHGEKSPGVYHNVVGRVLVVGSRAKARQDKTARARSGAVVEAPEDPASQTVERTSGRPTGKA